MHCKAKTVWEEYFHMRVVIEEKKGIDYIERYVNPKDPALYIRELHKRCEEKIKMFKKEFS